MGVTLAVGQQPAQNETYTNPAGEQFRDQAEKAVDEAAKPADQSPKADAKAKAEARAARPSEKSAKVTPVAGLNQTQMNNAQKIVETAESMGLGRDAQIIAVATAMQESTLYNRASTVYPESYAVPHEGDGSDFDSVGLFQQRSSTGWGNVRDLMKPEYATQQFLKALVQVPNWERMPLTVAAQRVQGSAFPDHYAKHEGNATRVVDAINNSR